MKKKKLKKLIKEALDEWVKNVEYLHSPTDTKGRYFCSKPDCEGVKFKDKVNKSDIDWNFKTK